LSFVVVSLTISIEPIFFKYQPNKGILRSSFLRIKIGYCKGDLTFDHLLPKSKGGLTDWENVVTACSTCNVKKGGKLFGDCDLKLFNKPYRPTVDDLHKNGKNFPPNFLHESWMDYLYWDIELEP
tara:strand:+ start:493 stop:867 length:375 start_codon:yes stop_codon:yes gene_type:complete